MRPAPVLDPPWPGCDRLLHWRPSLAYPIVFSTGFVGLLLEISAGRLLAPAVGVSLETWSGIIAVVLAGLAIGDTLGGQLVDRHPTPRLLAATLALGGAAVLLVPWLASTVGGLWPAAPLMLRVVVVSTVVLLVPSALLGAVPPMASRLALRTVEAAGRTVGGLSATSSASSVLGVVLTGFIFLERFGVRMIVLTCGAGLVALAAVPLLTRELSGLHRSGLRTPAVPPTAPWSLYALPLLSGAAIMAVELAGTRLGATMFGTSLYTWTSAIGVVLLGVSVGTALGGRLADRFPSSRLLGLTFLLAAGGTLWVLAATMAYARLGSERVRFLLSSLPPAVSLPLLFGVMLLPASMAFGAVTPITIRLRLQDVEHSGTIVGRAYAAQAVGSIAGTIASGFVLISHLGTRALIVLLTAGAILVAALVGDPGPPRLRPALKTVGAVVFVFALVLSLGGWVPSPCLRESNYYCIRVRRQSPNVMSLTLDSLVHTLVNLKDPTMLLYEYEQGFAMVMAERPTGVRGAAPRVLLIGGGGYAFPRYVQEVFPRSVVDVVEIDPAVTEVTYQELGLPRSTPIRSWNQDGRQFLLRNPERRYDLIFGDAFRDAYSVPYHLTTLEFARMIAGALEPGGAYAANVIDGRAGLFLRSYVRTLEQVFPHVVVLPMDPNWRKNPQITSVVVASGHPIDAGLLATRRPPGVPETTPIFALSAYELQAFLESGPAIILTDDRAPVENFLATVYAESIHRRRR